jgi:hypothetical protein
VRFLDGCREKHKRNSNTLKRQKNYGTSLILLHREVPLRRLQNRNNHLKPVFCDPFCSGPRQGNRPTNIRGRENRKGCRHILCLNKRLQHMAVLVHAASSFIFTRPSAPLRARKNTVPSLINTSSFHHFITVCLHIFFWE